MLLLLWGRERQETGESHGGCGQRNGRRGSAEEETARVAQGDAREGEEWLLEKVAETA